MMTIDFKALIESLSEEAYAIAKNELSLFFEFYYCAPESISREMFLEKLCEYINRVGQSEKSTDDALARDYVDELFPLIDSRVEKGSQAEKYFERAKSIQKRLKDNSEDSSEAMLEDFSKIFLCMISSKMKKSKSKKKLADISFHIADVDFPAVIEAAFGEKRPLVDVGKAKDLALKLFQKKNEDTQDRVEEKPCEGSPAFSIIREFDVKRYSKKSLVRVILTLFFLQLSDYEGTI